MSQPVKLSDELVLDARIAGQAQERSIAGQVEFWAKLGRSMELLLEGRQLLTLCRTVGTTPLADLVGSVDTPKGREMLRTFLDSEPYPHFEPHPTRPALLVRIEENGECTVGRFVNRVFVSVPIELGEHQVRWTLPSDFDIKGFFQRHEKGVESNPEPDTDSTTEPSVQHQDVAEADQT